MTFVSIIFSALGIGAPRPAAARRAARPEPTISNQRIGAKAPARLSTAEQWDRLTGILTFSIERAEGTQKLQSAAGQQLDLAQYALSNLLDELSFVMTLPGRRGPASVHVLEPSAGRGTGHALAA